MSVTDLDKIIGTPGIFVCSLTLALNFSLAKPNVFGISFFMDCAIVSMSHSLSSRLQLYLLPTAHLVCFEEGRRPFLLFLSLYTFIVLGCSFLAYNLRMLCSRE